jgi:hypothetical protein
MKPSELILVLQKAVDAEEPKCEEDIYYLESKIQKNIKMRIGFERSTVTIINFKTV